MIKLVQFKSYFAERYIACFSEIESLDKLLKETAEDHKLIKEISENLIFSVQEWPTKLIVPTNFPEETSELEAERIKLRYEQSGVIGGITNRRGLLGEVEISRHKVSGYADSFNNYSVAKRLKKPVEKEEKILPLSEEEIIKYFSDLFERSVKENSLKRAFIKGLRYSDLSPTISTNFRDLPLRILTRMREEPDQEKVRICLIQLAEANRYCWSRKLAEAYNIDNFLNKNTPATTTQVMHHLVAAYRDRIVYSIGKAIGNNNSHVHSRIIKVLSKHKIESTPASRLENQSSNSALYRAVKRAFLRTNSPDFLVAELSQLLKRKDENAALSFLKENILDTWTKIFEERTGHPSKENDETALTE